MIYLSLSILFSSLIYVLFSLLGKYRAALLPSLITNYFVAGICAFGYALYNQEQSTAPWFFHAVGISVLFITIFLVMAKTTQQMGLATASVASKMSVIVPVIVAIIWLNESVTVAKISGLILGLLSVAIISRPSKKNPSPSIKKNKSWLLPVVLFLGSGCIDTFLKVTEEIFFKGAPSSLFIGTIFCFAGIFGWSYWFGVARKKQAFTTTSIFLGSILGVVNFGSIYFILQSLSIPSLEASVVFPINNVAIVALSTVLGLLLFKQKLTTIKVIGLVLAVAAVFLLY